MNKSLEFKMTLVGCIAVFVMIIGVAIIFMRPRSASSTSIHKEVEDSYSIEEVIDIEIGKLYDGTRVNVNSLVKQMGKVIYKDGLLGDYQIKDMSGNCILVSGKLNWIGPDAEDNQCEVGIISNYTDQIYGKLQSFRLK